MFDEKDGGFVPLESSDQEVELTKGRYKERRDSRSNGISILKRDR